MIEATRSLLQKLVGFMGDLKRPNEKLVLMILVGILGCTSPIAKKVGTQTGAKLQAAGSEKSVVQMQFSEEQMDLSKSTFGLKNPFKKGSSCSEKSLWTQATLCEECLVCDERHNSYDQEKCEKEFDICEEVIDCIDKILVHFSEECFDGMDPDVATTKVKWGTKGCVDRHCPS